MTDPRCRGYQYRSGLGLSIIEETHRRYGVADADVFTRVTRAMEAVAQGGRILDIGAGTGAWYRTLRKIGAQGDYVGVDQAQGVLTDLAGAIAGDPRALVMEADAMHLPFAEASFDWVGLHFVVYFLPDMSAGISEAWRLVKRGGVMAAACNGPQPHRELHEILEEAARELGLPGLANSVTAADRFNLDNGAGLFPKKPEVVSWPSGFRFPDAISLVRYADAGPINKHLGEAAWDPEIRTRALKLVQHKAAAVIDRQGQFTVHSRTGFFLLRND